MDIGKISLSLEWFSKQIDLNLNIFGEEGPLLSPSSSSSSPKAFMKNSNKIIDYSCCHVYKDTSSTVNNNNNNNNVQQQSVSLFDFVVIVSMLDISEGNSSISSVTSSLEKKSSTIPQGLMITETHANPTSKLHLVSLLNGLNLDTFLRKDDNCGSDCRIDPQFCLECEENHQNIDLIKIILSTSSDGVPNKVLNIDRASQMSILLKYRQQLEREKNIKTSLDVESIFGINDNVNTEDKNFVDRLTINKKEVETSFLSTWKLPQYYHFKDSVCRKFGFHLIDNETFEWTSINSQSNSIKETHNNDFIHNYLSNETAMKTNMLALTFILNWNSCCYFPTQSVLDQCLELTLTDLKKRQSSNGLFLDEEEIKNKKVYEKFIPRIAKDISAIITQSTNNKFKETCFKILRDRSNQTLSPPPLIITDNYNKKNDDDVSQEENLEHLLKNMLIDCWKRARQ